MRAEFINPFLASLLNVLKTMASLDLMPQKPCKKLDDIARGNVSGIIKMNSPETNGSMSVSFDEQLALKIMDNMLGETHQSLDNDIIDMVGEITNMVSGGAKTILAERGFNFSMATPEVLLGKGHSILHQNTAAPVLIMPFVSPWGKAFIEINFD